MIDPLNIFSEIKTVVLKYDSTAKCYAFGSRVRGNSTTLKWDFDIIICSDKHDKSILPKIINNYFEGRVDENNRKIKVDIWNCNNEDTLISTKKNIKLL